MRTNTKTNKKMLKSITDFNSSPAYCMLTINGEPLRIIEKDTDATTYFHIVFPQNRTSVWKMLCSQANHLFTFVSAKSAGQGGSCCDEQLYSNEFGPKFCVNLSNDYAGGEITVYVRIPTSAAAIQRFIDWMPNETNCICDLKTIIHIAAAQVSVNETYQPGTLLGNYND